jgi:hypothetical protein
MSLSDNVYIHKQTLLTNLQNIYNNNRTQLYSALAVNIKNIQKSRLNLKIKQSQLTNLINQYYYNVNILNNVFNKNKLNIQNFVPTTITINNNKKALLIGINYTGTSNELYGCINDVNLIKERISQNGFTNITILTDLTSKKATRDNILNEFKNLLINSQEGDLLFLLFSGHGSNIFDKNNDEIDGNDELIISCDFKSILDDELKTIIQNYLKKNVTLFAMFDSCFSGSVLDLKYQYLDTLNYDKFTENSKDFETLGNVLMISGCTDKQTSADSVFNNIANGAMTWSLLESLKQTPNCNWRELLKKMRELLKSNNYEQIPQFSSGTLVDIDLPIFI